jgi:hypothetical protein
MLVAYFMKDFAFVLLNMHMFDENDEKNYITAIDVLRHTSSARGQTGQAQAPVSCCLRFAV